MRTCLVGCLFPAPKAFGVPVTGDSNNLIDAITVKEEREAAQSRNGSSAADSTDGQPFLFRLALGRGCVYKRIDDSVLIALP